MQLYQELEQERSHAIDDVRTCRDGAGVDDDVDAIADMLTMRMDQIADHRQKVLDALARLADGTYGVCVGCGMRIPPARLEASPEAIRCVDCQRRADGVAST